MTTDRSESHRACVGLLLVFLALAVLLALAPGASAQTPPSSDPTTSTTQATTTTQPATSTTQATTTTSSPPRSSTTTAPPRSTTSTTRAQTTTSESTTTLEPTTTTTAAPELVTDDTLPRRAEESGSDGMSTDTKLALVVGGLVAVGVMIGVLTFFYWRHTRPQRYMTALDALADVEQKVPRNPDDVPTSEHVAVPATGAAPGSAATATAATTAVRILEPEEVRADGTGDGDSTGESNRTAAGSGDGEPAGPAAGPVGLEEPTVITTLEDLRADAPADRPPGDPTA